MRMKNILCLAAVLVAGAVAIMAMQAAHAHEHGFSFWAVTTGGEEIPLDVPLEWAGGTFGSFADHKRMQENTGSIEAILAGFALQARIVGLTSDDTHVVLSKPGAQLTEPLKPYMVIPAGVTQVATTKITTAHDIPKAERDKWTYIDSLVIPKTHVLKIAQDAEAVYSFTSDGFSEPQQRTFEAYGLVVPGIPIHPSYIPLAVADSAYPGRPVLEAPLLDGFRGPFNCDTGAANQDKWDGYIKRLAVIGTGSVRDRVVCMQFEPVSLGTAGTITIKHSLTARVAAGSNGTIMDMCILNAADICDASLTNNQIKAHHIRDTWWNIQEDGKRYNWEQTANKARHAVQINGTDTIKVYVYDISPSVEIKLYDDDWTSGDGGPGRTADSVRNYAVYNGSSEPPMLKDRGRADTITLDKYTWKGSSAIIVMDRRAGDNIGGASGTIDKIIDVPDGVSRILVPEDDDAGGSPIYTAAETQRAHGNTIPIVNRDDIIIDRVNDKVTSGSFFPQSPQPVLYDVRSYVRVPIGDNDIRAKADLYRNNTDGTETRTPYLTWADYEAGSYMHIPVIAGYHGILFTAVGGTSGGASGDMLLTYGNLVGASNVHIATNMTATKAKTFPYPIKDGYIEGAVSAGTIATHEGTLKAVFTAVSNGTLLLKNTFLINEADANCGILQRPPARDPLSVTVEVYRNGIWITNATAGAFAQPRQIDTSSPVISDDSTSFALTNPDALEDKLIDGTNYKQVWYRSNFTYTDTSFFGSASVDVNPGDYVDFVVNVKIYGEFADEIRDPFAGCGSQADVKRIGEVYGRINLKSVVIETST